jgi:SWI/SNF-related matrix-associated actin-dependent regulator 1 of chromatin subfamily A
MIHIFEDKTNKLSGNTSLFLSFLFNQDVIDIIKSSGPANYSKNTRLWEVPITSLSYLLDNLVYFDDIKLNIKEEGETKEKIKPILEYKTKPFPYQLEGITYGLNNDKWLLLDSPGLGKSLQTIYLAEELNAQRGLKHCLIVCGVATLRSNWEKEIKRHSNKDSIIIGKKTTSKGKIKWETIPKRAEQLRTKIDEFFIIINIETLRSAEVVEALKENVNEIDMIIFDEAHKAKGWSSQQGKNLLKLKNFRYKVACTGTILMNNPLDAYVPLKWIDVEKANVTTFKNQYCEFGGFGGYEITGFKNLNLLKNELETCSLRRTKDLLDLPPKNIINELVELSEEHKAFYDNVKDGVKSECDKVDLNSANILALTTRLRQATSCPSVLTSTPILSSKLERCIDLVDEIVSNGDKVVIMSTFKEPVNILKEALKRYSPVIGTGDLKDSEVSNNIDLFQNEDKYKVFIGTTSKVGTGITLTRARYMICIDSPWTAALQEQVEDRIHRIGSTEPVFIYRLIADNTIDVMVSKLLEKKKAISDFIVDDVNDEDTMNILRKYIKEEI